MRGDLSLSGQLQACCGDVPVQFAQSNRDSDMENAEAGLASRPAAASRSRDSDTATRARAGSGQVYYSAEVQVHESLTGNFKLKAASMLPPK